jgi:iron complex transport system substrate-binding protein
LLGALIALLLPLPVASVAIAAPKRIISLSLCTDQLLLNLVPPERINAVSYMAQKPYYSFESKKAAKLPIIYGDAESTLSKRPDLIIASSYSARTTVHLLRRLGYPVDVFPPASNLDDILANIERLGRLTKRNAQAKRLIEKLTRENRALKAKLPSDPAKRPTAALLHANGYLPGANSLAGWIAQSAGYRRWHPLSKTASGRLDLEQLILSPPDAIIINDTQYHGRAKAEEIFSHPILQRLAGRITLLRLDGRHTNCGTPHILDAVRQLMAQRPRAGAAKKAATTKGGADR